MDDRPRTERAAPRESPPDGAPGADPSSDRPLADHLAELALEEDELWERAGDGDGLDAAQRDRLATIRRELDRCDELLRARRARHPDGAPDDGGLVR